MKTFFVALLLFVGASAYATPIESWKMGIDIGDPRAGGLNYAADFAIQYLPNATPVCDAQFDSYSPTHPVKYDTYYCKVADFVTGFSVSFDETSWNFYDVTSDYWWLSMSTGDYQAFGDFEGGGGDIPSLQSVLTLSGDFGSIDFQIGYDGGTYTRGVAEGTWFGSAFLGLSLSLPPEPVFNFAIVNGELVRRVPEPGTFWLFSASLLLILIPKFRVLRKNRYS